MLTDFCRFRTSLDWPEKAKNGKDWIGKSYGRS